MHLLTKSFFFQSDENGLSFPLDVLHPIPIWYSQSIVVICSGDLFCELKPVQMEPDEDEAQYPNVSTP